jgi:hypothetical protein
MGMALLLFDMGALTVSAVRRPCGQIRAQTVWPTLDGTQFSQHTFMRTCRQPKRCLNLLYSNAVDTPGNCTMTSVRGLIIALCWVLLTVANGPAMGATPIGRIVATLGEVHVLRQGEELPVTAGAAVFAADRLVTQARARARIALSDGSTLAMGADTALDLARYDQTETGVLSGLIRLLNGILRTRIDTPGAQIRIETRTAVASVRSTQWTMEADPDNTAVLVSEGLVTVSGRAGASVDLGPGEGTDVPFSGAASAPRTWGATRVAAFRERIEF